MWCGATHACCATFSQAACVVCAARSAFRHHDFYLNERVALKRLGENDSPARRQYRVSAVTSPSWSTGIAAAHNVTPLGYPLNGGGRPIDAHDEHVTRLEQLVHVLACHDALLVVGKSEHARQHPHAV